MVFPDASDTVGNVISVFSHVKVLLDERDKHITALLSEMDLRYQQRYDAQIKALDAALLAAEKAVQTALTAAEKAVTKAEVAAEKRFDSVNEFRQLVNDVISQQMPRSEAQQRLTSLTERIGRETTSLSERMDRDVRGIMVSIDELKNDSISRAGRGTGLKDGWGYLVGLISFIATVITIIVATRS